MKLVTYVPPSAQDARIGVLLARDAREYVIDARRACAGDEIPRDMIALLAGGVPALDAVRRGLAGITGALEPLLDKGVLFRRDSVKLLAPIPRPGKVVAIGANYQEHIREGRESGALGELPKHVPAFLKMSTAVIGTDEPIPFPVFGSELDCEIELSMVIGKRCRDVRAEDWLEVVAGFTIVNDLGLRDVIWEEKDTGIVLAGKNFEGACPMGPCIVTKDAFATPDDVALSLRVNGDIRQRDRTSNMIHRCAAIIAYWSRLGFEPGDVVTTGTPGGSAGFGRKYPERLLKVGDVIEAEIEGIGVLRNAVVGNPGAPAATDGRQHKTDRMGI